jgi:hypothetical protein
MSSTTSGVKQENWTKPAAMAIPKGGFFKDKVEEGGFDFGLARKYHHFRCWGTEPCSAR